MNAKDISTATTAAAAAATSLFATKQKQKKNDMAPFTKFWVAL